jgi:hypothetical protein
MMLKMVDQAHDGGISRPRGPGVVELVTVDQSLPKHTTRNQNL